MIAGLLYGLICLVAFMVIVGWFLRADYVGPEEPWLDDPEYQP